MLLAEKLERDQQLGFGMIYMYGSTITQGHYISGNLGDSCVFCFSHCENCSHLFFTCHFSYKVWSAKFIPRWATQF